MTAPLNKWIARFFLGAIVGLLSTWLAGCVDNVHPIPCSIKGIVDAAKNQPNASAQLDTGASAMLNAQGEFKFDGVSPGEHKLFVREIVVQDYELEIGALVDVTVGKCTSLDFKLAGVSFIGNFGAMENTGAKVAGVTMKKRP